MVLLLIWISWKIFEKIGFSAILGVDKEEFFYYISERKNNQKREEKEEMFVFVCIVYICFGTGVREGEDRTWSLNVIV